jgi:hypothetical protein
MCSCKNVPVLMRLAQWHIIYLAWRKWHIIRTKFNNAGAALEPEAVYTAIFIIRHKVGPIPTQEVSFHLLLRRPTSLRPLCFECSPSLRYPFDKHMSVIYPVLLGLFLLS